MYVTNPYHFVIGTQDRHVLCKTMFIISLFLTARHYQKTLALQNEAAVPNHLNLFLMPCLLVGTQDSFLCVPNIEMYITSVKYSFISLQKLTKKEDAYHYTLTNLRNNGMIVITSQFQKSLSVVLIHCKCVVTYIALYAHTDHILNQKSRNE